MDKGKNAPPEKKGRGGRPPKSEIPKQTEKNAESYERKKDGKRWRRRCGRFFGTDRPL